MKKSNLKLVGMGVSLMLIQAVSISKEENNVTGSLGAAVGGDLVAGSAIYSINNYNSDAGSDTDMVIDGGDDQLYESGWFYRVEGDLQESRLPSPDSETFVGDTALLIWYNVDDRNLFNVAIEYKLSQPADGEAVLVTTVAFENISNSPQILDVYSYQDIEARGTSGGDTASLTHEPDFISIIDTDALVTWRGGSVSAYQVTEHSDLLDLLLDNELTSFENSGLPFPAGDFTGGFQWSVEMPAFSIYFLQTTLGFNAIAPLPQNAFLFDDIIWKSGFQ